MVVSIDHSFSEGYSVGTPFLSPVSKRYFVFHLVCFDSNGQSSYHPATPNALLCFLGPTALPDIGGSGALDVTPKSISPGTGSCGFPSACTKFSAKHSLILPHSQEYLLPTRIPSSPFSPRASSQTLPCWASALPHLSLPKHQQSPTRLIQNSID